MTKYLIICPLVFLGGFVDSIAGGGGLITLPAYLLAGLPAHNAIGTNKMSSAMGTTISTIKYAINGFIPWKQAIFCVITSFLGSNLGAKIALQISDYYFKIIMLIILPLTLIYILTKKSIESEKEELPLNKTILISMLVSFVIGMYDGFYGPGTGTFLILFLTAFARVRLKQANGIAKAINLSTNISALIVYLINGKVLFPLGIIAGLFNVAGNYIGANLFTKKDAKFVKPVMIFVIVLFIIKIVTEIF